MNTSAYKPLKTVFHMNDETSASTEEAQRRKYALTLDFKVGSKDLFYLPTATLSLLAEQILLQEQKIHVATLDLPSAASQSYLFNLLIDEISATNEIEAVRSTRQEIEEALLAEPTENKRFKELAKLYLAFSSGDISAPSTPQELRTRYDDLLGQEISSSDALDGALFRKNPVFIKDADGRQLHQGVTDETQIHRNLATMLQHVDDPQVPRLMAAMIAHFMLEYTHPFYDGNGRFGRYLLSVHLSEVLSRYTVLTLSKTINEQKKKYYKAFEDAENTLNRGEGTFFIQAMLELIFDAQDSLLKELADKKRLLQSLKSRLEIWSYSHLQVSEDFLKIFGILGQVELFGKPSGISINDLASEINKSWKTTRKRVEQLENEGLVKHTSDRPLRVALSDQAKEILGLS
ncbi:cell division protein Fic [Rothia aerolata]|uniref:Cell division protein Fic n=2 Tax=Rothia aerolata TaxID=1812262 RepID=A0A917MVF5_9MICC|nr:cell division protein Fic [Rothia aerolata]